MAWMHIETTRAQIQIQTKRARLNIQNSMPRMRINRRNAEMHITRTNPTFSVESNRNQAYNAPSGISAPNGADRLGDDNVALTHAMSSDGKRRAAPSVMRGIKNANAASAAIGRNAAAAARPKVRWEPGSMKVDWSPHELEVSWEGNASPMITVDPYEIEIRLRNHPGVKIRLTDEYYAQLLGRNVDKKV